MKNKRNSKVIDMIMNRAIEINKGCRQECRDFCIMTSPGRKGTLILRWTTIDLDNIDNPVQCYHYECFYPDGNPQGCGIHYDDQQQANAFFQGLELFYSQQYATDHIQ